MTTTVIVTLTMPGIHFWPDAPDELNFLASPHRHQFRFVAEWIVTDSNREVEFFMAQKQLHWCLVHTFPDHVFDHDIRDFQTYSCEQIASLLLAAFNALKDFPMPSAVEVWEDGENGARIQTEGAH